MGRRDDDAAERVGVELEGQKREEGERAEGERGLTVRRQTNTAESWFTGRPVFWAMSVWNRLYVSTE